VRSYIPDIRDSPNREDILAVLQQAKPLTDPFTAEAGAPHQISKQELSVQSSAPIAEIDRMIALGLISGPDAAGLHDPGNITRLRLLRVLQDSDVPLDKLADAVAKRQLSLDFASQVVADQVGLSDHTLAEASAALEVDAATLRAFSLATGIPLPSAESRIRQDDFELLQLFAEARRFGVPGPVILGILRTFAIGIGQIVTAQREFFRRNVEDPMLAKGVPFQEMFATAAPLRIALQHLGYRATYLLQRRFVEQVAFENIISRFEEAMEATQVTRARSAKKHTIAFADLSGFTERTENLGDADAARLANELIAISQAQCAINRGSLVKPLGDGAMMHFTATLDALRSGRGIISDARDANLPPVRVAVAAGPVIMQDGDYFGRTVNLAARLLAVAMPNQVLATAEAVEAVRTSELEFDRLGLVRLKGFAQEVETYALRTGDGP
jgi:adenylate cyclase